MLGRGVDSSGMDCEAGEARGVRTVWGWLGLAGTVRRVGDGQGRQGPKC